MVFLVVRAGAIPDAPQPKGMAPASCFFAVHPALLYLPCMALRSLDSIPTSKAFVVPAARTCGDHMGPDPELPGFEKNASKAMASRAKVAPSEFCCFKFTGNDGVAEQRLSVDFGERFSAYAGLGFTAFLVVEKIVHFNAF